MRRIPFRVSFGVLNFLRERHVLKVACVKIAAGLRIGELEAPIKIDVDGRLSVPVKYPFGTELFPFIPTGNTPHLHDVDSSSSCIQNRKWGFIAFCTSNRPYPTSCGKSNVFFVADFPREA